MITRAIWSPGVAGSTTAAQKLILGAVSEIPTQVTRRVGLAW